jgi:hypothetical protein
MAKPPLDSEYPTRSTQELSDLNDAKNEYVAPKGRCHLVVKVATQPDDDDHPSAITASWQRGARLRHQTDASVSASWRYGCSPYCKGSVVLRVGSRRIRIARGKASPWSAATCPPSASASTPDDDDDDVDDVSTYQFFSS